MARKGKSAKKKKDADIQPEMKAIPQDYQPRLLMKYKEEVIPFLIERFGYKNIMEVPRLVKVSINMGIGDAARDEKVQKEAVAVLESISGQKPILRRARRSIAGFKVRRGMVIGCSVTLRRWRMYEFLDRLISIALPRVRDFRGLNPNAFDGRGNYTLGVRDQLIFPEVSYQLVTRQRGMNITIVTSAETDEEARQLLFALGFPFRGMVE